MALNERQKRFVAEYMIDQNATAAAKRAGYSEKTAYSQGQRLLNHVEIRELISDKLKSIEERLGITRDRILEEYAAIAFANVTDYVNVSVVTDEEGRVFYEMRYKDTEALSDTQKSAISGIKRDGNGIVINTHDKLKALDFLTKYMGMDERENTDNSVSIIIKGDVDGYSD